MQLKKLLLKEKVFSYTKESVEKRSGVTEFNYTFSTPQYEYEVVLLSNPKQFVDVQFFIQEENELTTNLTNEKIPFSVISTVIQILKDFWNEYHNEYQFQGFAYKGSAVKGENPHNITKRDRVFKSAVEKQFPNAKVYIKNKKVYIVP